MLAGLLGTGPTPGCRECSAKQRANQAQRCHGDEENPARQQSNGLYSHVHERRDQQHRAHKKPAHARTSLMRCGLLTRRAT